MPIPPKTPGLQAPTKANPVFGSHGKPAGMAKGELCKTCSKPADLCKCMAKAAMTGVTPSPSAVATNPSKPRSAAHIRGVDSESVKSPKGGVKGQIHQYISQRAGLTAPTYAGKSELEKADLQSAPAKVTPAAGSRSAAHVRGATPKMDTAPAAAAGKKTIPLSDLAGMVQRSKRKLPAPSLPGMTPGPAGSLSPESAQSISEAKALQAEAAKRPGGPAAQALRTKLATVAAQKTVPVAAPAPAGTPVAQANQEIGGFKSIAQNPTAMPGGKMITPGQDLAADKRAAGVGPLNALFAKLKGRGNATWEQMRGAGPASDTRALRAAGLQRSEMDDKSDKQ